MIRSMSELVQEAKKTITTISVVEAKQLLADNDCLLIDVRETAEIEQSAVKNSHTISRGVLESKITSLSDNPDTLILLHCKSGGRACLAAEQLVKMGYKNVKAITCSHEDMCQHFN